MSTGCSPVRVLFAFTGLVLLSHFLGCDGTIIAKSKITMCVKDDSNDPFNVVEGKKCQKKLVVTKAVTAGQSATEFLYINISKVDDEVDRDQARLYYPVIITVTQSPMRLVYPYKFVEVAIEGEEFQETKEKYFALSTFTSLPTVNNKPYETSRRHYWCQDGFQTNDDDDLSCVVRRDETTGERIWDSQGFCCRCSFLEDSKPGGGGEDRHHRGSTECGNKLHIPLISLLFKNHDRQSSHCMHYDDLWYNVHAVDTYRLYFQVFVKAYDLVEEEKDGKVNQKLVDGGKITLSNFKKSGYGKYGRILATLVGTFEPNVQFPSLTEKYLMMPSKKSDVKFKSHPQTKGGATDYMLIPKSFCAFDKEVNSCDKIGVTYTSFRMQGGHHGQGIGCTRKMGSCLNNQIKDYFEEDVERREQGKRPYYFPEKYGEMVGTTAIKKGEFALVYKVNEIIASTVTLEISADDMILIYNKASGIIVKAFATDFESLSRDGGLHVIVQNTGLISADFFVTVKLCSVGILRALEKKASINPQATRVFSLELRTTVHVASNFMCTVNLWDSRYNFLDSANVSFATTKACVCLQSCTCACTDSGATTERCVTKGKEYTEDLSLKNVKLTERKLTALESFFESVNNDLASITNLITRPTFGHVFNVWVFLCLICGLLKANLGTKPGGGPIAYFGWWWDLPVGKERFVDKKGCEVVGIYDKDGDLKDPSTGEVLKTEKQLLFVGNIFFFLLLICILGVRAARLYKQFEQRDKMAVSLSNVALSGTTVYRNFADFPDADKHLTNPGKEFSIAGKLERIKRKYKFIIMDKMQVIEVVDEELMLLTPAVAFDDEIFTKVFDQETALCEITLQPMYVCLNEEPTFDYYSEGEDEVPPTPPAPDYSMHELQHNSPIYERPSPII